MASGFPLTSVSGESTKAVALPVTSPVSVLTRKMVFGCGMNHSPTGLSPPASESLVPATYCPNTSGAVVIQLWLRCCMQAVGLWGSVRSHASKFSLCEPVELVMVCCT